MCFQREPCVFEAAVSLSSWTVPSVMRILHSNGGTGHPSLPAALADRGYLTACFTDNPHLGRDGALTREFDHVERSVGDWRRLLAGTVIGEVLERLNPGDDRDLVETATAWARRRQGPLFLYAHLMDSHTPYTNPPIDGKHRHGRRIEFPVPGLHMTDEKAEDVVSVRRRHPQRGHRDRAADRRGGELGRPFLAVVTADHGESLGDGGRWFHGGSLAPELLGVPLVVVGSGVQPGRVKRRVGLGAIAPTLLAAAGSSARLLPGQDLRVSDGESVIDGGLPPNLLYRIAEGHKLVLDTATGRAQLFDLRQDPGDQPNWGSTNVRVT